MKISIKDFNINTYQEELGKFLGSLEKIEEKIYSEFEHKVYTVCGVKYNKIFELVTGGIKILDYEWVQDHSVYKRVFDSKINDSLYYAINLEDSILLRGPKVYYYLVSYKEQYHNPTQNQVLDWKNNIKEFIQKLKDAISESKDVSNVCDNLLEKKYLLGILDHIRHFLVICLNAEMGLQNRGCTYFLEEVFQKISLKSYFNYIEGCYQIYEKILFEKFEKNWILDKIVSLLDICSVQINQVFNALIANRDEKLNGDCLKLHREADNFVENYITIKYGVQTLKEKYLFDIKQNISFFGILNGAIEFPILFYHFLGSEHYSYYYVNILGDYLQRHNYEYDSKQYFGQSKIQGIILDDNTMTGSTIEVAYDYIKTNVLVNIEDFFILRHPEINRIPQMKAYNRAVNIEFLKKNCFGLINHSPYSKIKVGTNYYKEYLDELGVFTLTGEFFLRYLLKNGLYGKNSEVDNVGKCRIP